MTEHSSPTTDDSSLIKVTSEMSRFWTSGRTKRTIIYVMFGSETRQNTWAQPTGNQTIKWLKTDFLGLTVWFQLCNISTHHCHCFHMRVHTHTHQQSDTGVCD